MRVGVLVVLGMLLALVSCEKVYAPKPKGYNRIDIEPSQYQSLPDTFPYLFKYPEGVEIKSDKSWIAERYWIDLHYPQFDADIQVTYKAVNHSEDVLKELLRDSYRLTSEHGVKAYSIDESVIPLENGMMATLMELSGEVPSQFQFHVTDSTENFLRCALYFKTATANDSLKPVIDHIKMDMIYMLNSLEWNK